MASKQRYFKALPATEGFGSIVSFYDDKQLALIRTGKWVEKYVEEWRVSGTYSPLEGYYGGFSGLGFKKKCKPKGWIPAHPGSHRYRPSSTLLNKASNAEMKRDWEGIQPLKSSLLFDLLFDGERPRHIIPQITIVKDEGFITDIVVGLPEDLDCCRLNECLVEITKSEAENIAHQYEAA